MTSSLLTASLPASLRRRSITRNVLVNWAIAIVSALTALGLTPVVVGRLSPEGYGVWTFINGLTFFSNLLYVGLGAAFMKRLSEAVGRSDVADQTRLAGLAFTMYSGLGLLCLAIALVLGPFVPSMLATPLLPDTRRATSIAVGFLGMRLACTFVNAALSALLTAHGRLDLVGLLGLAVILPRTAGILWASGRPDPLVWLAIVSVIDVALLLPALATLCRIVAPDVRIRLTRPTAPELRVLYGFGVQAFVVQVAALVVSYADTALVGVVLGAAQVGMYALPLRLIEQSRMVVNGVTQNLAPELSALTARGETARLPELFLATSRACVTLSAFVNVHLVLLGPTFLTLWVGPAMAEGSPRILLCLAAAATAAALSTQVMTPFYLALDLVRALLVVVVAEAVLNVGLSYRLAHEVGLWGVALGTALPALGLTLVVAPRPILAQFGIGTFRYLHYVLWPPALLVAASIAVQALFSRFIVETSYVILAGRVAASLVVALPLLLATLERHELPGPMRRFSIRAKR